MMPPPVSLVLAGFLGLAVLRPLPAQPSLVSQTEASQAVKTALDALPAGESLIRVEDFAASGDDRGSLYTFKTSGPAADPVWEVATLRDASPPWAIQVIGRTTQAVKKNETGLLRFRGRVTHTLQETGQGQIRVNVQRMGGDYQRSASAGFNLTRDWQEFLVPVRFASNYEAGQIGAVFAFGYPAQTVELTDVALVTFGASVAYSTIPRSRVSYQGSDINAAWRRDANARIEKIRKGDLAVFVTDATGNPVPDAKISVEMKQHHFEFGTAVPFSLLMNESPDREAYRKALFSIFNAVGPENDLKWRFWADGGKTAQDATMSALRWLKDRDIPVRGHVFIWPAANRMPKSAVALIGTERQNEIPGMVLDHIREISAATAGYVSEWDVLNEPFSHHQLMDLFGREIMADWFKTAREALGPDIPLYFNDWGNHDILGDPVHLKHFIDTARFIQAQGGPIDGLGLQAHIGGVPPAPETLLATLDHYQKELGLPIRVTEFDFTTDDPLLHADYTRDFLIAYFSHPLTAGIQFWGFWEKAHWRPQAALFDKNWKETPAGTSTRELIRKTWWTRSAGDTDPSGRYATRGFYGRYLVRATLGERTVETEIRHLPGPVPTAVRLILP